MFHLAACPGCGTLQLQKDLDLVDHRTCRGCDARVPSPAWQVEGSYDAFEPAQRDLRRLRERGGESGFHAGPPIPEALVPLKVGGPDQRARLASLLRELADAGEELTDAELVDRLADVDCAHLRSHLVREDIVVPVGSADDDPAEDEAPRWRVRPEALEQGA